MERAGENRRPVVGKPVPSVRDMGSRRALRDINNLVGAPPYPCAIAKKPMLEKSGRDEQEPALVSRRPVMRRFAAFLGSEEHPGHQATATDAALLGDDPQKKPIPDGTIDADVESCESADDTDMFLQILLLTKKLLRTQFSVSASQGLSPKRPTHGFGNSEDNLAHQPYEKASLSNNNIQHSPGGKLYPAVIGGDKHGCWGLRSRCWGRELNQMDLLFCIPVRIYNIYNIYI